MNKWELIIWITLLIAINPAITHFLIIKKAKLNKKGKIVVYTITTGHVFFWCSVSTKLSVISAISFIFFVILAIFNKIIFKNIRES